MPPTCLLHTCSGPPARRPGPCTVRGPSDQARGTAALSAVQRCRWRRRPSRGPAVRCAASRPPEPRSGARLELGRRRPPGPRLRQGLSCRWPGRPRVPGRVGGSESGGLGAGERRPGRLSVWQSACPAARLAVWAVWAGEEGGRWGHYRYFFFA